LKAVIIGAGISGLSTAYYLARAGWDVHVLEKGEGLDNCSHGNAGMVVPSHFTPLAAPGMVAQGIRWMFDGKSPFYVRPSLDLSLVDWGLKFLRHANEGHVRRHAEAIRDLNLYSSRLYDALAEGLDFGLRQNGILMLYRSAQAEREEKLLAERAVRLGLDAVCYDADGAQALEPHLRLDVMGGVLYTCDGILDPQKLMAALRDDLANRGAVFHWNCAVTGFRTSGRKVTEVLTAKGGLSADGIVAACGSALPVLAAKLGLNMPLMPGKGYSFLHDPAPGMSIVHGALLLEARVAVTPMNGRIRFGGTMELGPANDRIYPKRVRGIVEAVPKYFPDLRVGYPEKVWYGYRPCPPDGLPYLGRTRRYDNVGIAGGGGMMGLSLGPAFGKTMADLLSDRPAETDISGFDPDRFL